MSYTWDSWRPGDDGPVDYIDQGCGDYENNKNHPDEKKNETIADFFSTPYAKELEEKSRKQLDFDMKEEIRKTLNSRIITGFIIGPAIISAGIILLNHEEFVKRYTELKCIYPSAIISLSGLALMVVSAYKIFKDKD